MEAVKAAIVRGEGKAVTSRAVPFGSRRAASLEALILEEGKILQGSGRTKRPALSNAMFNTGHAGGEQG